MRVDVVPARCVHCGRILPTSPLRVGCVPETSLAVARGVGPSVREFALSQADVVLHVQAEPSLSAQRWGKHPVTIVWRTPELVDRVRLRRNLGLLEETWDETPTSFTAPIPEGTGASTDVLLSLVWTSLRLRSGEACRPVKETSR